MSLTRVYTTLNSLIIRTLGDTGGPQSSRVDEELNNIITGFVGVGKTVFTGVNGAGAGSGTVTTNVTTIAANTLAADGDWLEIQVFGRFTSSANNKEIRLNVNQGGTQILCTTGTFTTGSPTIWEARALVRRDGSTTLDSRAYGIKAGALYGQTELFLGGTWNWGASFTVDIVTVDAAANEVFVDRALIVKYAAP